MTAGQKDRRDMELCFDNHCPPTLLLATLLRVLVVPMEVFRAYLEAFGASRGCFEARELNDDRKVKADSFSSTTRYARG